MTQYTRADRVHYKLSWQNTAELTRDSWADRLQLDGHNAGQSCKGGDNVQQCWLTAAEPVDYWKTAGGLKGVHLSWQFEVDWERGSQADKLRFGWPAAAKADRLPSRQFQVHLWDFSWADRSKLGWHILQGFWTCEAKITDCWLAVCSGAESVRP